MLIICADSTAIAVIIKTLQQIINATWVKEGSNLPKLSHWIRCLFTLAIPRNPDTAMELAEKAVKVAQSHKDVSRCFCLRPPSYCHECSHHLEGAG